MICGWNPRLGSSRRLKNWTRSRPAPVFRRQAGGWFAGPFLAICWILLSGSVCLAAALAPVLEFLPDAEAGSREQGWLEQDKQWLAGLPPLPGFSAVTPDSAAVLRRIRQSAESERPGKSGLSRESRLRDRWLERGYLGVEVLVAPARETGPDTLRIRPGPVYRLISLDIDGNDFPGRERLLEIWLPQPGETFDPPSFRRGVDHLLEEVGEAGYPFARWVISSAGLDPLSGTIALQARLLPGQRANIGPVTSDLVPGPGRNFLVKATGLHSGALFQNSDLERAVDRLKARDLYQTVDTPRVYLTSAVDTVGIHFPVTARRKVNRLQVVLGLSRQQDNSGNRLSGQVDLDLPNLAGTGRRLQVGWQDDGGDKSRFGFYYLEPLAFGTPLDMSGALDHEVETDLFTRFRVDNVWSLPVVARWGMDLGLGWDRSTFPTGDLEGTSRRRVLGAIAHRRGDRSASGWDGRAGVETAWRSAFFRTEADSAGTSAQLGQGSTQRILLGDLAGERWFGPFWSLAGRASFRQLRGSEKTAPLSEQFRFGGANTLRGYREDEFHGTSAAWGALELRIGRSRGSRLYTFCDLGYFEFSALDPLPDEPERRTLLKDWPWGFGLGLLARTTAGDLSLAVGFPGTVDFQVAKLHVSLMESF